MTRRREAGRLVGWLAVGLGLTGAGGASSVVRPPDAARVEPSRAGPNPRFPPSYRAGCYSFTETARTTIRSRSGGGSVDDRAGRDGVLVVVLEGGSDSLALVAWYDSLSIWRETGTGREAPETDGFVGGRYRGRLTTDGRYDPRRWPFVPSEVAEVADLEPALDDFLPRLPSVDIPPGGNWRDGAGLEIRRESDLADPSGPIHRYRWKRTRRDRERVDALDTLTVALDQAVDEEGELRWSAVYGPLGWTRRLVIRARIPAEGRVKRGMHTVVEQDITVFRRIDDPLCEASRPETK